MGGEIKYKELKENYMCLVYLQSSSTTRGVKHGIACTLNRDEGWEVKLGLRILVLGDPPK